MEKFGEQQPIESGDASKKEWAENIAREKLDKIMDEKFRDFAIRFVGIDEYKDIVKENYIRDQEVFVVQKGYRDPNKSPNFSQYLEKSKKKGWVKTAYSQTNWEFSTKGMDEHKELSDHLKKAHAEAQTQHETKDIKVNTIKKLRDYLLDPESDFNKKELSIVSGMLMAGRHYMKNKNELEELKRNLTTLTGGESDKILQLVEQRRNLKWEDVLWERKSGNLVFTEDKDNDIKKVIEQLVFIKMYFNLSGGEDKVAIVSEFIENPEDFISSDKLHKLFQALTWGEKRGNSQYQVALIFDMSAVNQVYGGYWEPLKRYSEDDRKKPNHNPRKSLLASISVIPDREFASEISKLSAESGEWSHPVFNSNGVLLYPEKK